MRRLTAAQAKTLEIIRRYARETGRRCFTYNDILRYWQRTSIAINANTLERRLRELARYGILRKEERIVRGRRRRFFCLDDLLG